MRHKSIYLVLYLFLIGNIIAIHVSAQTGNIDGVGTKHLPQLQMASQVALPKFEVQKTVEFADYLFHPMNTYANNYVAGQCTYGVASMKGDIPDGWGNAGNWYFAAQASGYQVSSTPIIGSVGVSEAGWLGHVVVVTGLNGDGTIEITEMNYDGWGDGLYRTRTASIGEFSYIYI